MKIYRTVLKMLMNNEKGVLVTVVDSTPSFEELKGKRCIFKESGFLSDNDKDFNDELLFANLQKLCLKIMDEGKFRREKLKVGDEWIDLMLEPILPMPRLIILGCGYVGQALAQIAYLLELPLVVVDDRSDFANKTLFPPKTRIICDDFSRAIEVIDPKENDFVVIVTRGHKYDRICLEKLAGKKLAYIGMIGSRRRVRELFSELIKEGVDSEWLSKVHAPIGLDIGAETPAEIGVSIMAEIIQIWRKGA
ncbi:XdhC family protein [Anoxybacter fermentans]|uniref:XdhC family protein n=1 Tax=Anoxybacter fermentans TaxID=1323375 RepID=UPI0013DFDE32|nr:XdhC family protein [Anoxybacter fermentans]